MDERCLLEGHRQTLVSSHYTSQGIVRYLRCACGRWQVELAGHPLPGTERPAPAAHG
ncbi:hypothetical protein [Allonocardiopsis opalescens]|uniref:Uncharacterized protein n=1 Tax=Allonocardiopsis opalescens TaxID=1144618 RepID=A0A2T0QCP4_9ACTN|nr:hypothetical protein [Allonocardiopsis opalescens]PRY01675.1 hypothetical protein CLV72_101259 [Allonocardiopsis opalescens]